MSLTALAFLAVFAIFVVLSFISGPIWGVLNYIFVYLISPNPHLNWWASAIPDLRWSLIAAAILLISMVLHKDKLSDHKAIQTPVFALMIIFFLLTLVLSFSAIDVSRHYERCYDLFRYIVVYFLLIKVIKTEHDITKILLLLVVCGTLLGYFAYTEPRSGVRLEGIGPPDAADANNLAIFFAGILPFILPLFFHGKVYFRFISIIATAFIVNGIVLCNSRGGMVSVAASVAFGVMLIRDKRLKRLALGMVFLLGVSFLYLADDHFWERSQTISTSFEEDGASGRIDIWRNGLKMAADYPLGTGGGGFQALSPYYMPADLLTAGGVRSSHNTYLLILVEQGFLGLLLYSLILFKLYLHLWKAYKYFNFNNENNEATGDQNKKTYRNFVVIALIVSLVSQNIGALVSNRLYYEYFFILISLITVYNQKYIFKSHAKVN